MQDRYDTAFLGILQNEGNISKFLDSFFSFLYRKTDFYVLLNSPTDRLGFPPGVARKLLLSAFQKYETKALQDQKRKLDEKEKLQIQKPKDEVPDIGHIEEVITEDSSPVGSSPEVTMMTASNPGDNPKSDDSDINLQDVTISSESQTTASTIADNMTKDHEDQISTKESLNSAEGTPKCKGSDDEEADPELTRLQKIYQANPESYNGAIRDNYSWSQSITDVDVRVKVPKHVCKGKDVSVEVGRKHLKVTCKDINGQVITIVDGDLIWECHKDECVWSLVPGEHIHVNLEKVEERWWDALLTSEPKISIRKIDPSRPMTDLDDEAQSKIEEMMYNEHQKRLGLPQTHEKKVHDILAQAWDAEGSPFKGQPFDPSKINISSGGMM